MKASFPLSSPLCEKPKTRKLPKCPTYGQLSKSMCFPLISRDPSPQRLSDFLDLTRSRSRGRMVVPIVPLHRRLLPEISPSKKQVRATAKRLALEKEERLRLSVECSEARVNFDLTPWSGSSGRRSPTRA